jgi:acetolactate synthase-1/2/3 large subunit
MSNAKELYGGTLIAEVLAKHGVRFIFTLCGGHISPILVAGQEHGLRIIDVRHEATTVFAADAVARLTGIPGVAAVTAGPGLTNTITAVKNAQMAQSPVIILGGATATLLKGRGSLQDIDQMALMKPHVKWATTISKVNQIVPKLQKAFAIAQEGIPGPVFLELPVDLLYPKSTVRKWHLEMGGKGKGIGSWPFKLYLNLHVTRKFWGAWKKRASAPLPFSVPSHKEKQLQKVLQALQEAERPVMVVGSQAMLASSQAQALQDAIKKLAIPTFLSGMARGLLGKDALHIRHKRSKAIREADVVILAGVACDFRLQYGQIIPKKATYIAINRSKEDLKKNRRPTIGLLADPGNVLRTLAAQWSERADKWSSWQQTLLARNKARDEQIAQQAAQQTEYVNPVQLCRQIEEVMAEDSVIIGDGGDFVATASYIVRPRSPLSWLDPGAFGTLGAGAGFALAAKLVRPEAEVWLIYGDGSAGYSLAEFDTFSRHNIPIIAVVGSDGAWAQIAREQVKIFNNPVGTELVRTPYHIVAQGYGGEGLLLTEANDAPSCLIKAKKIAKPCPDEGRKGQPVLLNAWIGKTDFRKGSISL